MCAGACAGPGERRGWNLHMTNSTRSFLSFLPSCRHWHLWPRATLGIIIFIPSRMSVCLSVSSVWLSGCTFSHHQAPRNSFRMFFAHPPHPMALTTFHPATSFHVRAHTSFLFFLFFFVRNTWLRILEDIGTAFVRRKDSSSYGTRFLCFGQPSLHQWLFIILK